MGRRCDGTNPPQNKWNPKGGIFKELFSTLFVIATLLAMEPGGGGVIESPNWDL